MKVRHFSFEETERRGWNYFDVICNRGLNRIDTIKNKEFGECDGIIEIHGQEKRIRDRNRTIEIDYLYREEKTSG